MDKYLQSKKSNKQFMMEELNFLPEKITEQDYIQLVDKNHQLEKEIFKLTQHSIKGPTIDIEKNRLQQIVNDQKMQYQKLLDKQSQNEFEITKLKQSLLDSQIKSEFYKEQMQNITKEFKNETEKYKNLLNLKTTNETEKKELENKIKELNQVLASTSAQFNNEKLIAEATKNQLHQSIELLTQNLNQLNETNQILTKNIQSLENSKTHQQISISELSQKLNLAQQDSQDNHLYTNALKQENTFIKEELQDLKNQIIEQNTIINEQKNINSEFQLAQDKFKIELSKEQDKYFQLHQQYQDQLLIIENLNTQINSKKTELLDLQEMEITKTDALKAQIKTFEESFIKIKVRFENVVKLYRTGKEETIPQLLNQLNCYKLNEKTLFEKVQFLSNDLDLYKKALIENEMQITLLKNKNIELQNEAEQARIVNDLKNQNAMLNLENELKSLQNQNQILQQNYLNLEQQIVTLENNNLIEVNKNDELKRQLNTIHSIKNELENKIQSQFEIISKQETKMSEMQKEDSNKTMLAHNYLKYINQEKQEFECKLNQMHYEVQRLSSLNPIKDILKVTDMEISKLELELKKLALAAPNRKALEHKMDQLFSQKTQLVTLISESEKKISEQQIQISQIKSKLNILEAPMPV